VLVSVVRGWTRSADRLVFLGRMTARIDLRAAAATIDRR